MLKCIPNYIIITHASKLQALYFNPNYDQFVLIKTFKPLARILITIKIQKREPKSRDYLLNKSVKHSVSKQGHHSMAPNKTCLDLCMLNTLR